MNIGLFFGSFNPVHTGHMIIANYMVQQPELDEVWLIVSPHNPLKPKSSLAKDYDRLHLVRLAIGDNPRLKASDIEFSLPQPSYTVDTLAYLGEKHPGKKFHLIMGEDNLASIHRWKNYEILLDRYTIYVYRRRGSQSDRYADHANIHMIDMPMLDISASLIRKMIADGRSVQYLVPDAVFEYLDGSSMYRNKSV